MLAYLAVAIAAVCLWEVACVLKPTAPAAPPPSPEIGDARAETGRAPGPGPPGDGWVVFRHVCHGDVEGGANLSPESLC